MNKSILLAAVVGLSGFTLIVVLTLVLQRGTSDTQELIATIIAFIGPTIGILVAMLRVDQVAEKVDTVHALVNGQRESLLRQINERNLVIKLLLSEVESHDSLEELQQKRLKVKSLLDQIEKNDNAS